MVAIVSMLELVLFGLNASLSERDAFSILSYF